jgi:hypothetical protein
VASLRYCGSVLLILASCFACGQDNRGWQTYRPNQEVRVQQLPAVMARSHDPSDVLLTSLDIVFNDPGICCGKDSALEDRAAGADPLSLKDIASKVQGRQLLSDGRPMLVTAEFQPVAPTVDISWWIIGELQDKHALLIVWNSHLYVLYGAVFDKVLSDDGSIVFAIHKLFLMDTRYSGPRREVTFNRDSDDWNKVQGMLRLTVAPQ